MEKKLLILFVFFHRHMKAAEWVESGLFLLKFIKHWTDICIMHAYWMLLKPWSLPAHLHFWSMTEAIMKSQNDFLFPIAYHLDNYFSKWYIQYTYNVDYWMQYRSFDRLLFTALHSIKRDVKLLLKKWMICKCLDHVVDLDILFSDLFITLGNDLFTGFQLLLSIPIKTSTFFGNSEHSFPEKQSIPFRNRVQFIF